MVTNFTTMSIDQLIAVLKFKKKKHLNTSYKFSNPVKYFNNEYIAKTPWSKHIFQKMVNWRGTKIRFMVDYGNWCNCWKCHEKCSDYWLQVVSIFSVISFVFFFFCSMSFLSISIDFQNERKNMARSLNDGFFMHSSDRYVLLSFTECCFKLELPTPTTMSFIFGIKRMFLPIFTHRVNYWYDKCNRNAGMNILTRTLQF